jgi:hypothetical protein
MNLGCKRLQRENHKRNLVSVWIKFMFTVEKRTKQSLTFLRGPNFHRVINSNRCSIIFYERTASGGKWVTYLKSLLEQCCRQTGSWYSNSSNIIGLQFVEEPSCDWEDPRGLWRAWLLGKRHTSRPFPCSRIATMSVNLYKSDTFNLCPNLRRGERCQFRIFFFVCTETSVLFK